MIGERERERLQSGRRGLLRIHAALLDEDRVRYDREHGRIEGGGAVLQLVIHDPWFAWLRSISGLIVQIDEALDDAESAAPSVADVLMVFAGSLRADSLNARLARLAVRLIEEHGGIITSRRGPPAVSLLRP